MPKASAKSKGGDKDSAVKNSFNPPHAGDHTPTSQTPGSQQMDPKNRDSHGTGMGDAPQMKK